MEILQESYLEEILKNKENFLNMEPFPFLNKKGIFKEGVREELMDGFPELSEVDIYNEKNANHLGYYDSDPEKACRDLNLNKIWRTFLGDFISNTYRNFLIELFDLKGEFQRNFEWSITNNYGNVCVMPHKDVFKKVGTNLYWFSKNWNQEEWGGRTAIIANYRGHAHSNDPKDWGEVTYANMDEECLFFKVGHESWHFMEKINHPGDPKVHTRKVFFTNPIQEKNVAFLTNQLRDNQKT